MKQCSIGSFIPLDYQGTEANNTICTNLSFSGHNKKVILFTSCNASDGKSFTVLHLAENLVNRGNRVCLVDADLRRSVLIRNAQIQTTGPWKGLAHFLAGYNEIQDVVYKTDIEGLYLVPIGQTVVNPLQLFETEEFDGFLEILRKEFDWVLIDTPPIGLVVDAAVIAAKCDGYVLVVSYNSTRRSELNDARRQMEKSGCPALGCIVNKVTVNSLSAKHYYNRNYYTKYYGKYYKEEGKSSPKKKK